MNKKVPFYSNTEDNTHCHQAVTKSILKYFFPEKEYTFKQLEEISGKKEGLWTWSTKTLLKVGSLGLKVKAKDTFDYERFANEGGEYLIERWGEEMGNEQIKNSDIPYEQKLMKRFLKESEVEFGLPTLDEIKDLLEDGWLVKLSVNYHPLYEEDGYTGHAILILKVEEDSVTIHDPGLPPRPDQKISMENFLKAWEYPDKNSRNYEAFKKA